MAQFETWLNADLSELPRVQSLSGVMFSQDVMGNKVGVTVTNGGENYTITGTITGYVIRSDNSTVVIDGDSNENKAWIELNEQAYAIPGPISIMIRETVGDVKTVLCACRTTVMRSSTDAIIDPGQVLPSVAELTARVESLESGAVDLAGDIGDLENALDGVKFIKKIAAKNNGKITYTFSGLCCFMIFTVGEANQMRGVIEGICNSSGSISLSQLSTSGASTYATVIAVNKDTSHKLQITNTNASYPCYTVMIVFAGTAPTVA